MKNKGWILVEVLAAALILIISLAAFSSAITMIKSLSRETSRRVEAINSARAAAEIITGRMLHMKYYPDDSTLFSFVQPGRHDETTDPDICTLPENYFTTELNGKLYYTVTNDNVTGDYYDKDGNTHTIYKAIKIITITVEWDDPSAAVNPQKEELIFGLLQEFW